MLPRGGTSSDWSAAAVGRLSGRAERPSSAKGPRTTTRTDTAGLPAARHWHTVRVLAAWCIGQVLPGACGQVHADVPGSAPNRSGAVTVPTGEVHASSHATATMAAWTRARGIALTLTVNAESCQIPRGAADASRVSSIEASLGFPHGEVGTVLLSVKIRSRTRSETISPRVTKTVSANSTAVSGGYTRATPQVHPPVEKPLEDESDRW